MSTAPQTPGPGSTGLLREPLVWLLVVVTVGLVLIRAHHTRAGLGVIVAAVSVAALLRLILTPRAAGLLAVRTRGFDVAVMTSLALGLGTLLAVVPFPTR